MYILFTEDIDKNEIIKFLENLGFTNSRWGVNLENAEGICTCYFPTEKIKGYTLLAGDMLSNDPRISWIHNRKQVYTVEDFKNSVIENIKKWNTKE